MNDAINIVTLVISFDFSNLVDVKKFIHILKENPCAESLVNIFDISAASKNEIDILKEMAAEQFQEKNTYALMLFEEPYFGWLSTSIPGYPDTLNLKTHVHTRAIGIRPFIELEPTNHPLAIEQREGITLQRVEGIKEIVTQYNQEDSE